MIHANLNPDCIKTLDLRIHKHCHITLIPPPYPSKSELTNRPNRSRLKSVARSTTYEARSMDPLVQRSSLSKGRRNVYRIRRYFPRFSNGYLLKMCPSTLTLDVLEVFGRSVHFPMACLTFTSERVWKKKEDEGWWVRRKRVQPLFFFGALSALKSELLLNGREPLPRIEWPAS